MTILPRGPAIRATSAEILFPFLGASPVFVGGKDDPAAMGRTARDLAAPAGADDDAPGSSLGTWPFLQMAATSGPDIPAPPAAARVLSWAEVPGAGRLKQAVAADPLHGLPAREAPHGPADLRGASGRDWLDRAVQADAFIFLPTLGSRDPADGAGSPAMPPSAEAWLDQLVLPPDPQRDFGPDLAVLPERDPLAADHVFF